MTTLRNLLPERVNPGDGYFERGDDAEDCADLMRREAEHRDDDESDVAVDLVYAVLMEPDGAQPTAGRDPARARDRLISRVVGRLECMIAGPAEQRDALQDVRAGLHAALGAALRAVGVAVANLSPDAVGSVPTSTAAAVLGHSRAGVAGLHSAFRASPAGVQKTACWRYRGRD